MSKNVDPIVAGVDGSACSIGALRWAADEANRQGRALLVVHAVPDRDDAAGELVDDAVAQARAWQPDVDVAGAVCDGRPVAVLCAESEHAGLVVLGSRGRGGIAGLVLGSVSTQVAMHSHSPVLVVHDGQVWAAPETSLASRHPVVVGVDGSPPSEFAAGLAFEEADRRAVDLMAVRAWQPPAQPWRTDIRPLVLDVDEIETAERHLLAESVAPWRSKYPQVPVQLRLVPGSPGAALVYASRDAQLMVVGARGRGGFAGLRLGSASHQVLHHARCPVLIARDRTRPGVEPVDGRPTARSGRSQPVSRRPAGTA